MDDSDRNKLFLGGVSWETTDDTLRHHFSKYGTVVSSVIAKDRNTGNPRGFAFVSFSDPSAVDTALQDTHEILGRTVEVKRAIPKSEQQQNRGLNRNGRANGRNNDQFRTKKIFVGGLSANLTEEEFKSYFERFGRITDVVVMHDNMTHRPRGFGFITFDSEDAVEEVMQKNFHELCGKLVEVKRAVPKDGSISNIGYNARVTSGSSSTIGDYQHGNYPAYSPRYGVYPAYGPVTGYGSAAAAGYPYGAGMVGGGFPSGAGAYGGIGYGVASFQPRSPWNVPAMAGPRGSPVLYGGTAFYPAYMNGGAGAMSLSASGFNEFLGTGMNGKSGQFGMGVESQGASGSVHSQIGRGGVDFNSFGSLGAASSNQSRRGNDENKSYSAGNSN
ncbi:heterogeneous nuclear ribonucleoprotein 1-like isoform X1 [Ipomoea triloba]|uniref:heterogeneous nuclear ribonucleoprotein 1-like isoform X1 n=2 Tax=Ipomoea triloba TaxID=35885 RepID=UPI00125CE62F|nr:heterogeneous nuclear ribonucleoprotein 1-like isoform X1 [Ipomoea triloba]